MSGPIYTYTLCTPDSASPMNQTTDLIRANFQAMDELNDVDHIGYNIPVTFGQHQKLTLPMQLNIPNAVETDIVMFSQLTPSGPNIAELFGVWPTGSVYQITGVVMPSTEPTSGTGWCQFPSGIIFKWGIFTGNTTGKFTVNFPVGAGIPIFQSSIVYVDVNFINHASTPPPYTQNTAIWGSATLTSVSADQTYGQYVQNPYNASYFVIGI